MKITQTIRLNDWQYEVFDVIEKYRFIVISAGRQSGKTFFCIWAMVKKAMSNNNSINWWVAPTYQPARVAFRRTITFLLDHKVRHTVNKTEMRIELPNGASIEFKSADREEGLRGETVGFMVIDEMGLLKRNAWQYALRGTVTATKAQVFFIGTPKGKNLFHELFCMGQDVEETEYISFQFESRASCFFSDEEWENVKRLPERVFQQEYQAKFIDDGGEVFRNIRACIKGDLEEPRHNKQYYAGTDLAKLQDFNVTCVLDQNGHLCAMDRFNSLSWTIQKKRIEKLWLDYKSTGYIDSTGIGDPILDDLNMTLPAQGYKFSNISKRQLIEALAMGIEKEEISYPDIPELINELSIFTFEQTNTGLIRYSAPAGLHDDIVIALALAYLAFSANRGGLNSFGDTGGRTEYDW